MAYCPIMTPALKNFVVYASTRPDIVERYTTETGLRLRYPDAIKDSANDNMAESGAMSVRQASIHFSYWLILTHWGRGPGVPEDLMAAARRTFPEQAKRMDEGFDRRLELVR